jgi:hypothetical protein
MSASRLAGLTLYGPNLLSVFYWLLSALCCLPPAVCCLLSIAYWLSSAVCRLPVAFSLMLSAG